MSIDYFYQPLSYKRNIDLSKDAFDGVKTNIFLIQFTELFSYLIYSKYMQYRSSHCQRPSDTVRSIFISVHKLCVIISLKKTDP